MNEGGLTPLLLVFGRALIVLVILGAIVLVTICARNEISDRVAFIVTKLTDDLEMSAKSAGFLLCISAAGIVGGAIVLWSSIEGILRFIMQGTFTGSNTVWSSSMVIFLALAGLATILSLLEHFEVSSRGREQIRNEIVASD